MLKKGRGRKVNRIKRHKFCMQILNKKKFFKKITKSKQQVKK